MFRRSSRNCRQRNSSVKRDQASAMLYRERQQINIRKQLGTVNAGEIEAPTVAERNIVRPKRVVPRDRSSPQSPRRLRHRQTGRIRRLRKDADTAVLSQRARRPALRPMLDEPFMRSSMMHVRGVKQRNETVDIEQSAHRVSISSRSLLTSCAVTTRLPAAITSKPAATFALARREGAVETSLACNPRRKTSEITLPAVRFERAAISLAASKTSWSKSSVVRIARMLPHQMRPASHETINAVSTLFPRP